VKSVLPDEGSHMSNKYEIIAKNSPPEAIFKCSDEEDMLNGKKRKT
jgi:hypothetical protein